MNLARLDEYTGAWSKKSGLPQIHSYLKSII